MAALETWEIILRLTAAMLAGGAIGLNRELHDKPIGLRTLGIVALATAMLVIGTDPDAINHGVSDGASRVIQGVLTGIGFLGAGVIVRSKQTKNVHGLTSAACVWLTACIGVVCALAAWRLLAIGLFLAFVLLLLGGRSERWMHHLLGGKSDSEDNPTDASVKDSKNASTTVE